jgi:hypothetical protein
MGVYSGWDSVKMKACITIVQFQLKYGRTLPPGKTRYPLYRRLGGPQGRSGRAENLAPPGSWNVNLGTSEEASKRNDFVFVTVYDIDMNPLALELDI